MQRFQATASHAAILVVVPGVAQRLWVVDIATGDATLATTSDYGVESNNFGIDWLRISTDGTKVAFESEAMNLDPADRDSVSDIYVKDITTGDLQLASVTAAGVKGNNNGAGSNYGAVQPEISGDGTHVSFLSNASNLGGSVSSSSDFNLYVKELEPFSAPPADNEAPTISINAPADGASYLLNTYVPAAFSCSDGSGSGVFSCTSTGYVDTYSLGQHTFTVDTTDYAGNSRSTSVTFDVVDTPPDSDGDGVTDDIDSGDGAFTDAIAGAPDTIRINRVGRFRGDSRDRRRRRSRRRRGLGERVQWSRDPVAVRVPGNYPPQRRQQRHLHVRQHLHANDQRHGGTEIVGGTTVSVPAGVSARVADLGGGAITIDGVEGGDVTVTTNEQRRRWRRASPRP